MVKFTSIIVILFQTLLLKDVDLSWLAWIMTKKRTAVAKEKVSKKEKEAPLTRKVIKAAILIVWSFHPIFLQALVPVKRSDRIRCNVKTLTTRGKSSSIMIPYNRNSHVTLNSFQAIIAWRLIKHFGQQWPTACKQLWEVVITILWMFQMPCPCLGLNPQLWVRRLFSSHHPEAPRPSCLFQDNRRWIFPSSRRRFLPWFLWCL